ncbi:MAG: prolyl oligopeptidase family serine peptidase, partial [Caldithrix sp.]|nr:prolyl oligopeptidase family serine peptidase [Caldithrix sp.]
YNYLTEKGYIIFTLDNRGTGGRGKAFKNLAYGDIGHYALKDHIEGAKYLSSLPYVDKDRIGIWGWSGGGYLTLMAMTKGSDYFKCGISVAPVSDFRFYDTIWAERYMGLPQDNEAGYDLTSVLTHVNQFKDGHLLVVHGTADDNVHMQNTMRFAQAMQQHTKPFDLMLYPEKRHSILGQSTRLHLYTMMTDYILEHL